MKNRQPYDHPSRADLRAALAQMLSSILDPETLAELDADLVIDRFLSQVDEGLAFEEELVTPALFGARQMTGKPS